MDTIRQMATQSILGRSLPALQFFRPTKKFLGWMKRSFPNSLIYDVGAGMGHVTKALQAEGLKMLAIDLNYRDGGETSQVLIGDGESCQYERGSVVMVCRPCHGQFTERVFEQSRRCGASSFLYVGLQKNVDADLGVYLCQTKLALTGAGRDREGVWLAQ